VFPASAAYTKYECLRHRPGEILRLRERSDSHCSKGAFGGTFERSKRKESGK